MLNYSPIFKKIMKITEQERVYQVKRTILVNQKSNVSSSNVDVTKADNVSISEELALPPQMPIPAPVAVVVVAATKTAVQDAKLPPAVPVVNVSTPAVVTAKEESGCVCSCFVKCLR